MVKHIIILGSTGSIGTQALEVITANPDKFQVVGIAAAGSNPQLIINQAQALGLSPDRIAIADPHAAETVATALGGYPVRSGRNAAADLVHSIPCDTVLNALVGSLGLTATMATIEVGATLALANKESLVAGGTLVTESAAPGQIVPVDSEHSAMAQCLRAGARTEVARLVLTASGGPFRGWTRQQMWDVTPEQAAAHPTWSMGQMNTLNSATLINKGLELIEASLLFDIPADRIDVTVHPQSIVHSMVTFTDGATIAQASPPDMRLPIALGLTWPERPDLSGLVTPNDWREPVSWTFEPLDDAAFPAVDLARSAVAASDTHPAVLNAANEQAVAAFLAGGLEWRDIVEVDAAVVAEHEGLTCPGLDDVLAVETWARARADELIAARNGGTHS